MRMARSRHKKQRRHSMSGYPIGGFLPTIEDQEAAAEDRARITDTKVYKKQLFRSGSMTGDLEKSHSFKSSMTRYAPEVTIDYDTPPTIEDQTNSRGLHSSASFRSTEGGDQMPIMPITSISGTQRKSEGRSRATSNEEMSVPLSSRSISSLSRANSETKAYFNYSESDGNKIPLAEDEEEQDEVVLIPCGIVSPSALWRILWDMQLICMLGCIAVFTPIRIGFGTVEMLDAMPGLFAFDLFLDILFLLDIVLNFMTAFSGNDGVLITERSAVALNYIRGYFAIDLVSGIPWSIVTGIQMAAGYESQGSDTTTMTSILKLTKISKLGRAMQMLKTARTAQMRVIGSRFEQWFQLHHTLASVAKAFMGVLFMVHVNACAFGFVTKLNDGSREHSWITEAGIENESWSQQYMSALYWSVTTITTVGYGDIAPVSTTERYYSIFAIFAGAVMYGSVISTFVASAAVANGQANQVHEKLDAIASYMRMKKYPDVLFSKVFNYYHHYYERKTGLDETKILAELSDKLRVQVSKFMAQSTFHGNRLFKGFPDKILTVILLTAKPLCVAQDEVVYASGESGHELYIVSSGKLSAKHEEDDIGKAVGTLRKHDNFGEQCVFRLRHTREETVTACQISEMLTLWQNDLESSIGEVAPKMLVDMRRRVSKKYRRIRRHRLKCMRKEAHATTQKVTVSIASRISSNITGLFTGSVHRPAKVSPAGPTATATAKADTGVKTAEAHLRDHADFKRNDSYSSLDAAGIFNDKESDPKENLDLMLERLSRNISNISGDSFMTPSARSISRKESWGSMPSMARNISSLSSSSQMSQGFYSRAPSQMSDQTRTMAPSLSTRIAQMENSIVELASKFTKQARTAAQRAQQIDTALKRLEAQSRKTNSRLNDQLEHVLECIVGKQKESN